MTTNQQNSGSKTCGRCKQFSPILYRIQQDISHVWVFVCPQCWQLASQDNFHYRYGGTWKQRHKSR